MSQGNNSDTDGDWVAAGRSDVSSVNAYRMDVWNYAAWQINCNIDRHRQPTAQRSGFGKKDETVDLTRFQIPDSSVKSPESPIFSSV